MKTIVITSDKGGVGKSTIAALIIEWLNFNGIKVNLIDADPIQSTRTWVNNCKSDGRAVVCSDAHYLIIDTAGTSGAGLSWIQKCDIIIAPFQSHYADVKTILDWFYSINIKLQQKVMFVPNRYQKTNEHKEGVAHVQKAVQSENAGILLSHLSNRPAIYGTILNGSSFNFFTQYKTHNVINEVKNLMDSIITLSKG
uniref:ParA-like protein n=1 Tax=Rickettsia monacensis TaxID=109232 RepID=A6MYW2_9RICK|nr:ParA family protein [Rickettsia monacensis]ABQ85886.1 ParA-like protein [Rickettsia monacensis]